MAKVQDDEKKRPLSFPKTSSKGKGPIDEKGANNVNNGRKVQRGTGASEAANHVRQHAARSDDADRRHAEWK